MHIAYNGWFWDQPNTGSGQYLRRLVTHLHKLAPEHQLTLVLPPHIPQPTEVPAGVGILHTQGFGGDLGKVWFEQRLYPAAVQRAGADIAHVTYWGPPLTSSARLVTSVLDVIPLALPEYAAGWKARLYTSLVTAAARGSAHTLTLSEAAKADIVKLVGLPPDSITVTYLAADEQFHPRLGAERDAEVRRKYDLPADFVLYLGGFDVRKQVNELLLAYTYVGQAEGENIPLVLAGKEPRWGEGVFPDLKAYAAELGINDYIRWLGYVDEADKPALYRQASVFVYPSVYEGFGLPVLEAMQSGTPVVAFDTSSIPEVAGDGAFLVRAGDARQLAGAIIALLLQKPLRESLVNAGLGRATAFNWRKTAKETLAVYEQVMALQKP
jgi:glycosyltransferase involved in cell wall biosynthesis